MSAMTANKTGIGLIALFGLGGIAFMMFPATNGIFIGQIWVVVAGFLALMAIRGKLKSRAADRVFKHGVRGRAKILSGESGAIVNAMPVMKLQVELDIPGHTKRKAEYSAAMPLYVIHHLKRGTFLPAYADPRKPEDFVLVW